MEQLVTQVQGLSGSADDLGQLLVLLRQNDDAMRSQGARLQPALHALDPAKHSLGFLFILDGRWSAGPSREEAENFLMSVTNFITVCSPEQIRYCPDKFNSLCRKLREHAMNMHRPIRAVLPLQVAIRKFQPSSEYLTPIHADFLLVCLLSKCYKAAAPILEDQIFEIDPKKTGLVPKDYLLYCYYGGMVQIGLKNFLRAMELLQHAFTAPAHVMNAIAVEAYKKYVLVCLIHNGQVPPFPKYTPSIVQRNLKGCCQGYIELVTVYNNRNITDLQRCLTSHEEAFRNDKNLGLAKQVVASLYKRNIQRLTQTYLTLSLQDIAQTVQLESAKDAELHVLQMIQDGEIFATINQKDGMVRFQEDSEQYKTREMSQRLHSEIQKVIRLAKKLTAVDEQVSCDQAFLSKVGRERTRYDSDDFELVPQKAFSNF
ncbi:hypothetical protein SELMODRAFT_439255 [Selaginella moellendorffii]|uniref:COP9 signalosome complex subunit 3 n=1 Tax=Selaginella moellendorffii TaxID=88036 RepID=D8R348_SELML|nr:COP9 signalosome complex subunit 3 [Selaginella moellendorffii]XP_024522672.1 COP9 signalosome complex subunit 3-like [Selaginella moellendorffii]EFJ33217.1 hypothetical protein SELMODRAFT_439255 [Selaginella moellendorffii]|eukprot:XP_002965797.1 COP9 signalosome complex subunit 3 [Selaginella moellendorffii]